MTRFTPSEHAKLLSQLDKHNGQNVEYWSKRNEFSSPFIEERLYLENFKNVFVVSFSALLSWSNIDQNNGLD